MEDDEDVVEITDLQIKEEACEEKPIISLFKRMISSNNMHKTGITNAQIKEILWKEFDLDLDNMHALEIDIYLEVVKKVLKKWTHWDIENLKSISDIACLNAVLQIKHKSLKKHLKLMIDIAMPLAQEAVKKLETTTATNNRKPKNLDDIVLEVRCNRAQLNKLFYRQPHPDKNGTIFNIDDSAPSRISLTKPTVAGILNSFGICVRLTINCVTINRFTCHEIDHLLVNKKLNIAAQNRDPVPNEMLQMTKLLKPVDVERKDIVGSLIRVYKKFKLKKSSEATTILELLIRDLAEGPETFKVPGSYRKFMSKYAYKRYLIADLPDGTKLSKKYDLQLEETISPRYQYTLHRYGTTKEMSYSLQIECKQCDLKFKGDNVLSDLEQHYLGFHSQETDITCANCNKSFSVDYLADKRWCHEC